MIELLVSCEHGGNDVPERYRGAFREHQHLLDTHRAFDPGAEAIARRLAARLGAPLYIATVTRLLIDLNRSLANRRVFSEISRPLAPQEQRRIIEEHYRPYRDRVEQALAAIVALGKTAVHISAHTFTPVLEGRPRRADIGILNDPSRRLEKAFALALKEAIGRRLRGHIVRLNYPYRGVSDGFTTHLRRRFPENRYLGIEIEVNQKHALADPPRWEELLEGLAASVGAALESIRQPMDLSGRA